jgi:hypothetical protein
MLPHQSIETLKHKLTCKYCGKLFFTRYKICRLAAHNNPEEANTLEMAVSQNYTMTIAWGLLLQIANYSKLTRTRGKI